MCPYVSTSEEGLLQKVFGGGVTDREPFTYTPVALLFLGGDCSEDD